MRFEKNKLKSEIVELYDSQPKKVKKFEFIDTDVKVIYGTMNGEVNIYNLNKRHSSTIQKSDTSFSTMSVGRKQGLVAFCFEKNSFIVGKYINGYFKSSTMHGTQRSILDLDFNSDCSYVATGSADKSVKFYDIQEMTFAGSFTGHKNWVRTVACSNFDRDLVASGSEDGSVKIWDMRCKSLADTIILPHSGSMPCTNKIHFLNNGQSLAITGNNSNENEPCGFFQLFDTRNLKLLQFYSQKSINFVSSDLKRTKSGNHILALIDTSSMCHLINLEAGLCMLKLTSPYQNGASDLKFSPTTNEHLYISCPSSNILVKWCISELAL